MSAYTFLLLNLALSFYNVGTIWAMEVDIFRSWRLVDQKDFHTVQQVHFKKLPYWIFTPVGVAFIGSVVLLFYHPAESPLWAIWGTLIFQLLSHILTARMWGPWQGKLSKDPLGSKSPYLKKILKTHWMRTALINLYAFTLLIWTISLH